MGFFPDWDKIAGSSDFYFMCGADGRGVLSEVVVGEVDAHFQCLVSSAGGWQPDYARAARQVVPRRLLPDVAHVSAACVYYSLVHHTTVTNKDLNNRGTTAVRTDKRLFSFIYIVFSYLKRKECRLCLRGCSHRHGQRRGYAAASRRLVLEFRGAFGGGDVLRHLLVQLIVVPQRMVLLHGVGR